MWHHVDVVDFGDELGGRIRLGLSHRLGEFGIIGPRLQPLVPLLLRRIARGGALSISTADLRICGIWPAQSRCLQYRSSAKVLSKDQRWLARLPSRMLHRATLHLSASNRPSAGVPPDHPSISCYCSQSTAM